MRENVDRTFEVIGLMEELRDIWRKTAPLYKLSEEEKRKSLSIIQKAITSLKEIEKSL
jgi:hypothetical protein